jgi:cation transport ATPase
VKKLNVVIAVLTLNAILITVFLQVVAGLDTSTSQYPVIGVVAVGGGILIFRLIHCMLRGEFGSDLLAGISIVTSVFLEEYLAGALVVLMLSGGAALEDFAMRRASSVLDALAKRNPSIAHRRCGGATVDVAVDQLAPGDEALVLPAPSMA